MRGLDHDGPEEGQQVNDSELPKDASQTASNSSNDHDLGNGINKDDDPVKVEPIAQTTSQLDSKENVSVKPELKVENSTEPAGLTRHDTPEFKPILGGLDAESAPKKEETPDSDSPIPKFRPKHVKPNIQLFLDAPSATEEAESTYETLKACTYANKSIGSFGQDEAMTCDCKPNFGMFLNGPSLILLT